MFTRPSLDTTLGDLHTALQDRNSGTEIVRVAPQEVTFHLDSADPSISLGSTEVPATQHAMQALGDLIQVPSSFAKRLDEKAQPATKNALWSDLYANTMLKDARVSLRQGFLDSIGEWGRDPIQPVQVVGKALNVLPGDAQVARLVDQPGEFSFDVYAPEGFAHGYGGTGVTPYADGNERDDITAGGLRFFLDMKHGLAPTVQEFLYRLACTNGMVMQDLGLKVDARGQSVDEVLAELEQMAQVAFGRVEESISHFYDLKSQRVENAERALRTIARERGIPNRSTMQLMDLAATSELPDNPSMFDLVNLVTNYANSPQMASREGGRMILESAGGAVIGEHATRCGHCLQKVHA